MREGLLRQPPQGLNRHFTKPVVVHVQMRHAVRAAMRATQVAHRREFDGHRLGVMRQLHTVLTFADKNLLADPLTMHHAPGTAGELGAFRCADQAQLVHLPGPLRIRQTVQPQAQVPSRARGLPHGSRQGDLEAFGPISFGHLETNHGLFAEWHVGVCAVVELAVEITPQLRAGSVQMNDQFDQCVVWTGGQRPEDQTLAPHRTKRQPTDLDRAVHRGRTRPIPQCSNHSAHVQFRPQPSIRRVRLRWPRSCCHGRSCMNDRSAGYPAFS